MPAYLIANIEIKDVEKIKNYLTSTPEILRKYSGRFYPGRRGNRGLQTFPVFARRWGWIWHWPESRNHHQGSRLSR